MHTWDKKNVEISIAFSDPRIKNAFASLGNFSFVSLFFPGLYEKVAVFQVRPAISGFNELCYFFRIYIYIYILYIYLLRAQLDFYIFLPARMRALLWPSSNRCVPPSEGKSCTWYSIYTRPLRHTTVYVGAFCRMANTTQICFVSTLFLYFEVLHHLLYADVVLCVSLELFTLYCALQYYTGGNASRLRFMDSVAGQQD